MARSRYGSGAWLRLGLETWALGWEAGAVMALRTLKLAQGGAAAQAEAVRMVTEKAAAAAELQAKALTGSLGASGHAVARSTVRHYGPKVRRNRKRLARGG